MLKSSKKSASVKCARKGILRDHVNSDLTIIRTSLSHYKKETFDS